jgi:hypothetical protein
MNTLETLKGMLRKKDNVIANEGVKITLIGTKEGGPRPVASDVKIVFEPDSGQKAIEFLETIKQNQMSNVSIKFPKPKEASKAPVIIETPTKIAKLKGKVGLAQDVAQKEVLLPEGGPRLGSEVLPKQGDIGVVVPRMKVSTKRVPTNIIPLGPEANIIIGDASILTRLPPPPEFNVAAPTYYMNNREIFVNFVNGLFNEYKEEMEDESKNISCEDIGKDTGEIGLLIHQKVVRDYINLYTPYRGLLLFHGLGSGKTCSSIAIAEGIKSGGKQVIIMTPASLQRNYLEEIKKCGDKIYRKNQFWEWIPIENDEKMANTLSVALGFNSIDYIRRKKGAWLTNVTKPSNYNDLSTTDKKGLNDQLDEMIRQKYRFINYNGLRRNSFKMMTDDFKNNIFDNAIVIIDEAHNLISRIVNKINKKSKFSQRNKKDTNTLAAEPLAIQIYDYLMRADNCRVVLLTGTPIINYPNEIAVLFNILRGYIKTWHLPLIIEGSQKVTKESLMGILSNNKNMDYIDYDKSSKRLTITRNPFGFESLITERNGYQGVTNEKKEKKDATGKIIVNERGMINDADFLKAIDWKLSSSDIKINKTGIEYEVYTALPDTLEEFNNNFINRDTGNVVNIEKFKRRIMGLTSYFRSAQEDLLPRYDKNFDKHPVFIPMSDYQFNKYEEYRHEERKSEKIKKGAKPAGDDALKEPSSTYRIFSRLACNFAMPTPPGRPIPKAFRKKVTRLATYGPDGQVTDVTYVTTRGNNIVDEKKGDLTVENEIDKKYQEAIVNQWNNREPDKDVVPPVVNKKELEKAKKALEKAAEDARKQLEKEQKALEKAEAKAQKVLEKAEEKERKKAEKKASKKGGAGSDDGQEQVIWSGDEDEEEEDEEDESDNEELMSEKAQAKEDDEEDEEDEGGPNDPRREDEVIEIEGIKDVDARDREFDELEGDEILESFGDVEYKTAIAQAYAVIKKYKSEFLTPEKLEIYSPKFLKMLENIENPEYRGLHLVYSQFRSMEGIGIFALVLEANGYAHFKIKKTGLDGWEINMSEEDMGKPTYALYTGTEEADEREILRNIYNGAWDNIPNNIAEQLRRRSANNDMGEIIKVLMITSAGSEGINLRNTRYVHIMEPYWHPVRAEQVIGRARRICSHKDLPHEMQTVEVFIYIMVFTQKQLDSENAIELRIKAQDRGKIAPYPIQTSDEKLYEISTIKERLSTQLLVGIKEASIDCATYTKSNSKEGLVCLSFGQPTAKDFSFNPSLSQDENDTTAAINRVTINWRAREFQVKGKQYILREDTQQVYDYESVMQARKIPGFAPILLGKMVKRSNGDLEIVKERL